MVMWVYRILERPAYSVVIVECDGETRGSFRLNDEAEVKYFKEGKDLSEIRAIAGAVQSIGRDQSIS